MTEYIDANLVATHALLAAIESGQTGARLGEYFDPEAVQQEYPSVVSPNGRRRPLADMLTASTEGSGLLQWQHYDIQSELSVGDRVVLELTWTAALAVPFGMLPPGHVLTAHVAMFLRFRGGLILEQSSYDCYEPFTTSAARDEVLETQSA